MVHYFLFFIYTQCFKIQHQEKSYLVQFQESRTHHHQSGHHPASPRQVGRHVPGDHLCHRMGKGLHDLKRTQGKYYPAQFCSEICLKWVTHGLGCTTSSVYERWIGRPITILHHAMHQNFPCLQLTGFSEGNHNVCRAIVEPRES